MKSSALWLGLLAIPAIAHAQEFSAEGVAHNAHGQTARSKIYVEHAHVRVEPVGGTSYELLDTAQVTGFFIIPKKKLAVIQTTEVAGRSVAPYDVGENPCGRISVPSGPPPSCKKIGVDQLNGRPAEKWQIDQTFDGKPVTSTMWIDRTLHTVVKSQSARGMYELTNIQLGKQADALFAVPPGYARTDMSTLSFAPAVAPKK